MKLYCNLFLLLCVLNAYPQNKALQDALKITKLASKYHVQPPVLNDSFSSHLYTAFLKSIDEDHLLLLDEDVKKLGSYQYKLDEAISNGNNSFFVSLIPVFKKRLQQADSILEKLSTTRLNLLTTEKVSASFFDLPPASLSLAADKWKKKIQNELVTLLQEEFDLTLNSPKKLTDSLEVKYRKRLISQEQLALRFLLKDNALEELLGQSFCSTVASLYDPHTAYFTPDTKNDFEAGLSTSPQFFGFGLEDEEGSIKIKSLKPGSPAYQSGQLNEGDEIEAIRVNNDSVSVSADGVTAVAALLDEITDEEAVFTIKKTDGSKRQVMIKKEKTTIASDDGKVKSFVLKGEKTIGYISLPAFYFDWEDMSSGINGCANDVAKEILILKKEKIDGLILDLRYNGGGSLTEATELAGIFIDAGPVAQIKSKDEKIYALKDVNRGAVYDGPLIVLINGQSASASEFLAASLQDYNRALIVGSPSYGKATGQQVLPLDPDIDLKDDNVLNKKADAYLKLTIFNVYRLTGESIQAKGVQPDIVLPDISSLSHKESDEAFVLKVPAAEANKYYKPLTAFNKQTLQAALNTWISNNNYYRAITAFVNKETAAKNNATVALGLPAAQVTTTPAGQPATTKNETSLFKVSNHAFANERIRADSWLSKANQQSITYVSSDAGIAAAYYLFKFLPWQ